MTVPAAPSLASLLPLAPPGRAVLPAIMAFGAGHAAVHFFFKLGLLGLLLVSVVDSSFVPLPIPGVTDIMIVVYAASHANLFLLVLLATIGSAIGGLISHAVGQAGGCAFLEKHVPARILKRATRWMESHAILSIALPAILPPPMPLSPFVLAAGAINVRRSKFMTAFTLSRLARHAIAAWLGIRYGKGVLQLWNRFSDRWGVLILSIVWTVVLVFTAIAIWKLWRTSKQMNLQPGRKRNQNAASTT